MSNQYHVAARASKYGLRVSLWDNEVDVDTYIDLPMPATPQELLKRVYDEVEDPEAVDLFESVLNGDHGMHVQGVTLDAAEVRAVLLPVACHAD